jgi:alpha-glucosidase
MACAISPVSLTGPHETLTVTISVDHNGQAQYLVARGAQPLLDWSPLGLLMDGQQLGADVAGMTAGTVTSSNSRYTTRGNHTVAQNIYREQIFTFTRQPGASGDSNWQLVLRVYDEGMAFRYRIPGKGRRLLQGEQSGWTLPAGSRLWYAREEDIPENNYEGLWTRAIAGEISGGIYGPITAQLPNNGGYLVITEAALSNYCGMKYHATAGSHTILPYFKDDPNGWTVDGGSLTPWRVCSIAHTLNALVNSDLITNLCPPPDAKLFPDMSYIKLGRAVWSWWSDHDSGGNFAIQQRYVDNAVQLGFEYSLVDAGWESEFPTETADRFQRLHELVDYAHADGRKVDIWVWKHWSELADATTRREFFARVQETGVVGVKIDFMDNESQQRVNFYEDTLKDAAKIKLMINFHGANKPTGEMRTYPNEITREGIKGLEYNTFDANKLPPSHNATLPFTRFLAGHGDYTPATFNPELTGKTTLAHQLALPGTQFSPLMHWADDPKYYLASPSLDVIKQMPSVWEETRVLDISAIGELAAFARRSGHRWFLFIINGDEEKARTLDHLDISFLDQRNYHTVIMSDHNANTLTRQEITVTKTTPLTAHLFPGGGYVAMFTPAKE